MKKLNFLLLTLPLLMLTQGARADILTTGEGTASSPYLISSVADLQQLSTLSNSSTTLSQVQTKHFKLTADIDMSSVDNFEPICHTTDTDNGFLGTFDGDGHVISNLNITIASNNAGHIALIGCLQKNSSGTGYVKNVILNTVTITNNYASTEAFSIGGLSGRDGSCTIENCAVIGFSISKENTKNGYHGNGPFGYLSNSPTSILRFCCTDYSSLAVMGEKAVTENSVSNGGILNIATDENLVYFGKYVNAGYASLKGKLTANINMSNKTWTGISGFAGTFNGDNFTISNLAAPLCLNTANGAAIKNLTLEGSLTGGQYFAPFVNYCNGSLSIDKCTNKVSVTAEGVQVGGFIGYVAANASATITNSENQGAITSSADQVGGFVGRLRTSANLTMTNCVNNADLTGLRAVGGMWGQANNGGTVLLTLCNNTGNITTTATSGDDSRAGGLVGFVFSAEKVTIEKCWNSGNVTGNFKRSGGIVGSVNSGTVEINNCYNIGNVSEKSAGRAILGYTASSNVSITNCWCSGNIQSKTLSTATYANCFYTHYGEGNVTMIAADDVESGKLCFDINNGANETIFYQTLSSDNHPVFDSNHELVFKTSSANDYYHNSVLSYLELVDNYNFSSTAETFTASTITYSRNMSNTWGTICLPFEVKSNDEVIYYTTGEINGNVLTLTSTETVPAGTPAIFKMQNGSGTYNVTGNDVEVKSTVQTEADDLDEINLVGVFEQQIFDDVTTDNDNEYYYISNNKFMHATRKLTINPFRAYFTTAKSSTPSNGFSIAVNDDITAISALTGEGEVTVEAIYTVDGKQLRDLQQGLNIVKLSNGKVQKILVK